MKKHHIYILAIMFCACSVFGYKETRFPHEKTGEHWLYLPNKIDPAKTYWVVVGVHGADWRNKGANGMAKWADQKDNVIVVGPKFSKTYQNSPKVDQDLIIGIFKDLQKKYKVHPKMFLYGYSGGSQFVHRFAMKQPEYVCGVSSHSGGSWGTGKYGKINPEAKHIPFAISCGEKDTGKAWKEAPYGRLEWFKVFEAEMKNNKFCYKSDTWPGSGHNKDKGVDKMTEECFTLATTGMLPSYGDFGKKLAEAKQIISKGEFDKGAKLKAELNKTGFSLPAESGWHDSKEALALRKKLVKSALAELDTSPATRSKFKMYQNCLKAWQSDTKPGDKALCTFMEKCPPSFWLGKEGSDIVQPACNSAAEKYVEYLRAKKRLNTSIYQKCIPLWEGLEVSDTLLSEYNAIAEKSLTKTLAKKDGVFKKRELTAFIKKWKFGKAVDTASSELSKQP